MTPDDLLRTPGEVLAEAREKAGFSLVDLAARTKIPPPMLEAIERDEYHRLSDPLYVRSFLRAYAVEVGLDPDEVLDLHARSTGARMSPVPGGEGVWEEQSVTINRVGLPWGRIAPAAVGAALAVLAIILVIRGCGGGDESAGGAPATPPAAVAEAVAQRETLLVPEGETVPDEGATREEAAPAEAAPVDTPPQESVADDVDGADVQPDPQPVATSPTPPPVRELPPALAGKPALNMAGPYRGDLVLRVLARGPVRVRVRRDGEHVYRSVELAGADGAEEVLPLRGIIPGRSYAVREGSVVYWRARDHFSLKLDAVAGVSVEVNGARCDLSRLRSGQEMILDAHAAE